jgi:hypothetical protein
MAEAIARHHRLHSFRGGPDKHSAFANTGRHMSEFPFVQINPQDHINFLVVDVDHADADLRIMHPSVPEPHWIILNPKTGHGQAGWMIDPVFRGDGANEHPIRYAESVQTALDNLVGNDGAFTRFLVRNPAAHSPAGALSFGGRAQPYHLGELMAHMKNFTDQFDPSYSAWNPHRAFLPWKRPSQAQADKTGRNNALFAATRNSLWVHGHTTPSEAAHNHAHDFAMMQNAELLDPLPRREVKELAASAVRQVAKGHGRRTRSDGQAADPWLSRLGRLGGRATTDEKRAAARRNAEAATMKRAEAAHEQASEAKKLRNAGHTIREIARLVGRAVRTVMRYLAGQDGVAGEGDITQPTGGVAPLAATPDSPAAEASRSACTATSVKPHASASCTPLHPKKTMVACAPMLLASSGMSIGFSGTLSGRLRGSWALQTADQAPARLAIKPESLWPTHRSDYERTTGLRTPAPARLHGDFSNIPTASI